jgi:anaerobic ribonucleoside-triphosphate reductase
MNNSENSTIDHRIECEIYSRVCGFYRPVSQFNIGKKEEFNERKEISIAGITKTLKE